MDLFLDTDVLLDVLARREPHYVASAALWTHCEAGKMRGHISVISFNNIYYIVRKLGGQRAAMRAVGVLRDLFAPVALDGQLLNLAIGGNFSDFEDAIQYHSALRTDAEFFLTRNVRHFPTGDLPALTPAEFLAAQDIGP